MRIVFLLLINFLLMASQDDKLNLLEDLSNVSEIATRTKLNIDKTPAVVSVLHCDKLKNLGVISLHEALETVPGIEISMGTAGAKQVNIRGNKSLVRDKLKLMINGVSINSELSGSSYHYLDMPIELIERVEVIRGPSSALYGSFAHIGAINVITKSSAEKDNLFFSNISSQGYRNIGFVQDFKLGGIRLNLDGYFVENENSISYGPYTLVTSQETFTSYEDFTNRSIGASIQFNKDISFQVRWLELDTENHFGYGDWPIVKDPKKLKSTSLISELRYAPELSKEISMDIKLGYKYYGYEGEARYIPYSVMQSPPTPEYDLIGKGDYDEYVFYSDISLNYSFDEHEILFGTYFSNSYKKDTDYYTNNPLVSEEINQPGKNIQDGVSRKQYALYLHDVYTISKQFMLNIGGRYDYYSDADSSFVPKLALLYNHNDADSYKFMYQRSFRAPSWLELYGIATPYLGDESLKSETIDTLEFVYSHHDSFDSRFSINLFYSNMQDFINRDSSFQFYNDDDIHSYGVELEWQYPISETAQVQSNYSFNHIQDNNGDTLSFIANHLANVMFFKQWHRKFNSGSTLRYVSKRHRENIDSRDDLDGYIRFDQTITYLYKSLTLQATVKNLFDEDICYPSQVGNPPNLGTYENDFPREGRTFWLSIGWEI